MMTFHGQRGGIIHSTTSRVAFAVDFALFVDFVAASANDFGVERQVAAGQTDAVELQFQVALTPEVAGIFCGFEVTDQIGAAGESLLAEFGYAAQVAEHGIADIGCTRGEVGFIESALQESAGGQDNFARAGG
jgi:hypothetical protein